MSAEDLKNNISSVNAEETAPSDEKKERRKRKPRTVRKNKKNAKPKKQKTLLPLLKRPLVCPPEAADRTDASVILGWIARAAVLFVAVFGMTLLVCDALGFNKAELGNVGAGFIALCSLIFTALLALCTLSATRRFAIPAVCLLLAGGLIYMATGSVFAYLYRAVLNGIVEHFYSFGYLSIIQYAQPQEYGGYTLHGLTMLAAALLSLLYSLAYVPFLMRRTRIAVPAAVSVLTLVPVFVYNLTRSNWGVSLVIAGFSGVLVMCVYDRFYQRRQDPDEFDTETCVFETEGAPAMPEELTSREQRRHDRKAAKAAEKAARKLARAEKRHRSRRLRGKEKISADEDISDYFSRRHSAKPKKKPRVRPEKQTPEARAAQKAQKAEARRIRKAEKLEARRRDRDILAARRQARAGARRITLLRASSGGYAGSAMLLVAFLILLIPTVTTKENFRIIEAIDEKMDYYREYVTALLMGDDPLLDELAYEGGADSFAPRSTEPQHLSYTGIKLMQVEAPAAYPIYLRGWIATDYDRETGSWVTASPETDTFKNYRATFGTAIDPAETMFYGVFKYVSPSSVADIAFEQNRYTNSMSKYGFIAMQVNMKRLNLSGHLVYMPSFTNRRYSPTVTTLGGKDTYALRAYGSSEASKLTYVNYFDGIYTGYRFAKDTDGYASVAYVTSMKNAGFYKNLADAIVQFNTDRVLIEKDKAAREEARRLYGVEVKNYGEFRTEADEAGNYVITLSDGSVLYTVTYNDPDGHMVIRVPVSAGTAVYTYDLNTNTLISKKTEVTPSADDEETGYVATADLPTLIRYLEFYSEAEKEALTQTWRISDYYTHFVYDTYTDKAYSKVISALVKKIIAEAHTVSIDYTDEGEEIRTNVPKDFSRAAEHCVYSDKAPYSLVSAVTDTEVYEQRHRLVMEFINWLKDNCTYTLTPTLSDAEGYDGVEKFLEITHEGYCVQFASALTLMLREAGIPARYVEGFIASDFNRSYGKESVSSYISYVRDSSAHAWVEVWYDGIGWVQYEATPTYYSDMYEYRSSDPVPITPIGPGGDDEPKEEDNTLTDEEIAELIRQQQLAERRRMIIRIVVAAAVILAVAAAVLAVFLILRRGARKKAAVREEIISRLEAAGKRGEAPIPTGEVRDLVRRFADMLSSLLAELGCAPKDGEFREDYAGRIYGELEAFLRASEDPAESGEQKTLMRDITLAELTRDLDLIAAAEFGGESATLPESALPALALLWRRLYGTAYRRRVSAPRRFVLFYLKQTL